MKTQSTPGPWVLTVTGVRCEVRTSPESAYAFTLKDEANARLIASAPELLEALTQLVRDAQYSIDPQYLTAARAALSLARGEKGGEVK